MIINNNKYIDILNYLLRYRTPLLFLYLNKNQSSHETEMDMFCNELVGNSYACATNYGKTRCGTSSNIMDEIFGLKKTNPILIINQEGYKNEHGLTQKMEQIKRNIENTNIIKISICPDHIFNIIKLNNNKWYMLSSWMILYNFNIIEINIDDFIEDFMVFYYKYNNKTQYVTQYDVDFEEPYKRFLAKYFIYTMSVYRNSVHIDMNLRNVRQLTNINEDVLNVLGNNNDFIYKDFYGENNNYTYTHNFSMWFYNCNQNNIALNIEPFFIDLNNLLNNCEDNKIYYKIKDWIMKNKHVFNKTKSTEYFDSLVSLANSLKNLYKFYKEKYTITFNESIFEDNLKFIPEYSNMQYYTDHLLNRVKNQYGGIFPYRNLKKIDIEKIQKSPSYFEILYKYWHILGGKYVLSNMFRKKKIYDSNGEFINDINNLCYNNVIKIKIYNNKTQQVVSWFIFKSFYPSINSTYENPTYIILYNNQEYNELNSKKMIMINCENANNIYDIMHYKYTIIGNTILRSINDINDTIIESKCYEIDNDKVYKIINKCVHEYLNLFDASKFMEKNTINLNENNRLVKLKEHLKTQNKYISTEDAYSLSYLYMMYLKKGPIEIKNNTYNYPYNPYIDKNINYNVELKSLLKELNIKYGKKNN